MHDGAVVIEKNKIIAASCILPVSERQDLPIDFGLRHRSGLGITEHTDALAIIISEETGRISIASRGEIHTGLKDEEIAHFLYREYYEIEEENEG